MKKVFGTLAALGFLAFAGGIAAGIPARTMVVAAGWILLASSAAGLAFYRMLLVRADHRIMKLTAGVPGHLHAVLETRENSIDHIGIPLTIAAVLYTAGMFLFLADQVFETSLSHFARLFSIR